MWPTCLCIALLLLPNPFSLAIHFILGRKVIICLICVSFKSSRQPRARTRYSLLSYFLIFPTVQIPLRAPTSFIRSSTCISTRLNISQL
ncbi:hypothetical protein DL93DRAFT_2086419 [Clavulina sp. PMI_390]|nr:hypothetical protein DL93DRAFT_2086419 [Clavulina sp. PMI_390]